MGQPAAWPPAGVEQRGIALGADDPGTTQRCAGALSQLAAPAARAAGADPPELAAFSTTAARRAGRRAAALSVLFRFAAGAAAAASSALAQRHAATAFADAAEHA